MTALFSGLCAGTASYYAVDEFKHLFGYDDTLDVFGIHAVARIIGAIMTGVFATSAVNPIFKAPSGAALPVGYIDGNPIQIVNQLIAISLTIMFAGLGSLIILKVVNTIFGLRVVEQHEIARLDLTQHGEVAYVYALKANGDVAAVEIMEKSSVIAPQELALEMSE
jgi:Amt family ammonium transporter